MTHPKDLLGVDILSIAAFQLWFARAEARRWARQPEVVPS